MMVGMIANILFLSFLYGNHPYINLLYYSIIIYYLSFMDFIKKLLVKSMNSYILLSYLFPPNFLL